MHLSRLQFPTITKLLLVSSTAALLAACAGPKDTISLIPADQIAQQTSKDGLFTQPVKWTHEKPGCSGQCPTIKLDSIAFPGVPVLTKLVDNALAYMTGVGDSNVHPYTNIAGYEKYFWETAAPRDSTVFAAKTRYRNANLTVIELDSWQYLTGAAHGLSATQFLNWDNSRQRVLGINDVLQKGQHPAYVAALSAAYKQWLAHNSDARQNMAAYKRLWPFQASNNFALTDHGVVVKYNAYEIAPYSSGQPELVIPYSALQGILKPQYMPSAN